MKIVHVFIPFFAAARVSVGKVSLKRVKKTLAHAGNLTAIVTGVKIIHLKVVTSLLAYCFQNLRIVLHSIQIHSRSVREVVVLKTYKIWQELNTSRACSRKHEEGFFVQLKFLRLADNSRNIHVL